MITNENEKVVEEILALADTVPGLEVELDPADAERAGAFLEDALSYRDAIEGSIDRIKSAV